MPVRSKVKQLPPKVKTELDHKLIESAFSDYAGLSEWLKDKGYAIGKSSIDRYGKKFEERLDALNEQVEFAHAFGERFNDGNGAMSEMLNGLAQDTLCRVLIQLHQRTQNLTDEDSLTEISRLLMMVTKSLSDINRVDIAVKKYAGEMQEQQAAKLAEIESDGTKRGIDAEFMHRIKTEVLGLF